MKTLTALAALGIVVALGATVWTQQGTPRMQFDGMAFDAGQLTQGQKKAHVFRFSNQGKGALVIERVKPDCQITASAVLAASSVQPGEDGVIQVEFDSSGSDPGKFERFVEVSTNDPRQRTARLRVFGIVMREFRLSRAAIDFSDVKTREGSRTENVVLTIDDASRVRVLSVDSSDRRITAQVAQGEGRTDGRSIRIVATIARNATPGWLMGNIIVTTDSQVSPTVLIPVRGRILGSSD